MSAGRWNMKEKYAFNDFLSTENLPDHTFYATVNENICQLALSQCKDSYNVGFRREHNLYPIYMQQLKKVSLDLLITDFFNLSRKELKSIPKFKCQTWFEVWKKHPHKCIISNPNYFEGNINVDEKKKYFFQ